MSLWGVHSILNLAMDTAFVGRGDLIHAGSENPGKRVHFQFVPAQVEDERLENEVMFKEDRKYPN